MESYLKGRSKAQNFQVKIPPNKESGLDALKASDTEPEQCIRAEPEPDVLNAPDVDLIVRKGVVRKIIIRMPDGKRLELDCVYEGEDEDDQ